MDMTTGAILRRITQTPLSVAAHKLATVILDGIAWKEGYNGLARGTAAFTLAHLAEKMGVSRQHLTALLAELAQSGLRLTRWKPNGKFAPWLFRFGGPDTTEAPPEDLSATGDTSTSKDSHNKTVFTGRIDVRADANLCHAPWIEVIRAAKATLPCWNVDSQTIWERFLAFNRARGHTAVPAGFLLGFMRKWRAGVTSRSRASSPLAPTADEVLQNPELVDRIRAAPVRNRHFHEADLRRKIGSAAYDQRVQDMMARFGCLRFPAMLAVHGDAARTGEITR